MTTPDHIGKYEALQLIGQGGFGNVYRAWDPDLRRQVAVKVMHAQFAQDEQWVASFQQPTSPINTVDDVRSANWLRKPTQSEKTT